MTPHGAGRPKGTVGLVALGLACVTVIVAVWVYGLAYLGLLKSILALEFYE